MKLYEGVRTPEGTRVTVDGRPLDLRHDLHRHSPDGAEWGYCGSGPATPPSRAVWMSIALISAEVAGRAFVSLYSSHNSAPMPAAVGVAIDVPLIST